MTLQPPLWPSAGVCWARKGPAASAGLLGTGRALPESRGLAGCLPALGLWCLPLPPARVFSRLASPPFSAPWLGGAPSVGLFQVPCCVFLPRCWSPAPATRGWEVRLPRNLQEALPAGQVVLRPFLRAALRLHLLCGGECFLSRFEQVRSARRRLCCILLSCAALSLLPACLFTFGFHTSARVLGHEAPLAQSLKAFNKPLSSHSLCGRARSSSRPHEGPARLPAEGHLRTSSQAH